MDKQKAAAEIIMQALPDVPFDGWNQSVLNKAAVKAGYKKTDVIRVFPGGAIEAVDTFMHLQNQLMKRELENYSLSTIKIRERIATCVRVRLTVMEPYREAVRRAVAMQSMPFYATHALQHLYETVDEIWHLAGDTSTDFNFYTKRLLLAGVYSATLLTWLNDTSPGYENSWAFLARRIDNVMMIEKAKYRAKEWFKAAKP